MATKLLGLGVHQKGNLHLNGMVQNLFGFLNFFQTKSFRPLLHKNLQFLNLSSQAKSFCCDRGTTVATKQTSPKFQCRTKLNQTSLRFDHSPKSYISNRNLMFRAFATVSPCDSIAAHGSLMCSKRFNKTFFQVLKAFHFKHFSSSKVFCNPSKGSDRTCWHCGRDTNPKEELYFCKCGIVQEPAESLSYFELMQIDTSFDLDLSSLGRIFRNTQKQLHPDKFSSKSQEELHLAEKQSSMLNKAYHTLLRPLSRAIYMLEMNGIAFDEKDTISDPEFLMDIMSINERINDAASDNDIKCLQTENNDIICKCIQEISLAFQKHNMEEARRATIKLRYYTTIQERIAELQRNRLG